MEIRFSVDDNYIKELRSKVKGANPNQIASEALGLFNWAVNEIRSGRKIVSLDVEKEVYKEITTPVLSTSGSSASNESNSSQHDIKTK